jgi:type IV pilus assembly protein PilQ
VKVSKLKEIETGSSSEGSSSGSSSGSSGGSSSSGLVTLKGPAEDTDLQSSAIVKSVEKILSERGKVSVDDRSNSLIVTDSEDRLKMIESAIAQLDRALDQVLINVLLVETYENLDRALGIEWGNATTGVLGTITGSQETTSFPFRPGAAQTDGSFKDFFGNVGNTFKDAANQFNPTSSSGTITAGTRDFRDFRMQIRAMEAASKLKILAKPKILALDNQPALIKISTQTAIGTTSVTAAAGGSSGTTTEEAERAETGTILRVTPLINTGGRITLTVEPTFATADASAINVGGAEALDPTTRTARTTLMVNDGQTIALGGMLFSTQSNGNRKVPFFGNIPVIGKAFFTSNDKVIQDRELILFVTPNIISDPSMLETPAPPENRLHYDDETAPFWKVKQRDWYKELKDGPQEKTDFEGYFNVRKKLIDSTLDTLDQGAKASLRGK